MVKVKQVYLFTNILYNHYSNNVYKML